MPQQVTDSIEAPMVQHEFIRNILNALPGAIVVLDQSCKILRVNNEWNKTGSQTEIIRSAGWPGANYFDVAQLVTLQSDREFKQFNTRIKEIITGKSDSFEQEYFYKNDKEKLWFHIHANGFDFAEKRWVIISLQNISEQKKREADLVDNNRLLSEQKEQLEKIFESLEYPLYLIDVRDYSIAYANSAAQQAVTTGASSCHVLLKNSDTPCDSAGHICPLKELKKTGKPAIVEHMSTGVNGERQYIEVHGYPIFDRDGILVQIIEFSLDITRRKLIEEELRKSEEKFRDVFNSIQDVFIRADSKGRCIMVSPSVLEVTGYSTEDVMGRKLSEFYTNPKSHDALLKSLQEVGIVRNFEVEINKKDGSSFIGSTNSKIIYTDAGHPVGVESIFRDITASKKIEEALHKSEINLVKAQEVAHVGRWSLDLSENNLIWTDETYKIFGIPKGTPMSYEKFLETVYPEDRDYVREKWSAAIRGEPYDIQHRILVDNEVKWVREKAELKFDEKGNPVGGIGITQDINDQKNAEEQISSYQQKLKNLTTEITLTEENLRKKIAIDLHDHVGQLLASSRIELAMLNDISDRKELLSRTRNISKGLLKAIQATRSAIFDLSPPQLNEIGLFVATSDWMEEQIEMKYGIKTELSGDNQVFPLDVNITYLLFRSIREILLNVVKHARATKVIVDIRCKGNTLTITIKDNGIGFKYTPGFLRLKSDSYGLFSIQERMENIGGSMEINSIIGKGTEIKLMSPIR